MVEALGYAVHLLSADALNEQMPRLTQGVIALYRKHSEHYYITQVTQTNVGSCLLTETEPVSTLFEILILFFYSVLLVCEMRPTLAVEFRCLH